MKRVLSALLALAIILSMAGMITVSAVQESDIFRIESLDSYERNCEMIADDGYIGIPVGLRVYIKDPDACTDRTRVMIYVVNTNTANVGNGDDETVLTKLVNDGHIVVVMDYFNNEKSVTPDLDWSIQNIRSLIRTGAYINDVAHHNNGYVIPQGYDIALNQVYWSIDKHSAAGTLEYIVQIWNSDVLGVRGERTITFAEDTVISGISFTAGQTLTLNEYTAMLPEGKVTDISQCLAPDGTLIDMDLYLDIIYPVDPDKEVPVMLYAASGADRINTWNNPNRSHLTGFLFDGYAAVPYDYSFVPMARDDHYGYFDGDGTGSTGGVTGIQWSYGIGADAVKINTAAVRMIRYLAATEPETYAFDADKFGVTGISKSGVVTLLGAENPETLAEPRYNEGTSGETRYEAGELTDVVTTTGTIRGAEEQPWQTYPDGSKISSQCQFVYSNVGGYFRNIQEGHSPMYICGTMATSGSYYDYYPHCMAQMYQYDIPVMDYLCEFVGHSFCYGPDLITGNDTYAALFDCANYWLLDEGVKCEYILPLNGSNFVSATDKITVKFNATVPYDEFTSKVTITNDATGAKVNGVWTASYGGTLYEFTPYGMEGGYSYTVTVPATLKGENGKLIQQAKMVKFTAAHSEMAAPTDTATDDSLSYGEELFFRYEDLSFDNASEAVLRLRVTNEGAANILDVYAAAYDGSAYAVGEKLGSITVCGAGEYDFDVTEYVGDLTNIENVAFCVKTQKEAGETVNYVADFDADTVGANTTAHRGAELNANVVISDEKAVSGNSMKLNGATLAAANNDYFKYYNSTVQLVRFTNSLNDLGSCKETDYGRRFKVSFQVYDTTSRQIMVQAGLVAQYDNDIDTRADVFTTWTKAGQWITCELDASIDDVKHFTTLNKKNILIYTNNHGADTGEYPLYIDNFQVTEIVTDVSLAAANLVADPATVNTLTASDMAYVESGSNADSVMDATSGVLVSGQSQTLANGSQKVYVKLPLADYTSGAYSFSFDTDASSKGKIAVYGISDVTAGQSWTSETITYLNAPANNIYGNGVDTSMVLGGAPFKEFSVNGTGTYTVDLTIFAQVMKAKGADSVTLILTPVGEAENLLNYEHFENDTWASINPYGGIHISTNKYGKLDGVDHTIGDNSGSCAYLCPASNKTERIKIDALGLPSTLTEADVGRTLQVTLWAKADKAMKIHLYLQGTKANHVIRELSAADTWEQITWTFTITEADVASNARTLTIAMENGADGLTNLYVDDIEVKEIGLGTINVTPNVTVVPDKLISLKTFDDWTTTDWVDASLKTDANGVVDLHEATNRIYQYSFSRTATGNKIVESQDATTGSGKSYAFTTTSSGPRAKFYGTLDSLSEADIGRTFTVSFKVMLDSLQTGNTKETISYGMLSALDRRSAATNGLEGEVVDAANYQTAFYVGSKVEVTEDQLNQWIDCSFTFTLDANMLPRTVTSGSKEYKVGIGMFGFGLTSYTNAKEGSPTIYIDNIMVTEAAEENAEVVTPYTYKQNFETVSDSNLGTYVRMQSPETRYLSATDTSKTAIDTVSITTEDVYSGENSVKVISHAYSNGVRLANCFELELGAEYTISFRLKANKAGALWAGLNASGNGLYHNGKTGTYQTITIAEEDVGQWVQYSYSFTVDQTMIDSNMCYFILRSGMLRNTTTLVTDTVDGVEVYNAEKSSPLVMYLDDISAKEIVEGAEGVVESEEMVTVSSDGTVSDMDYTLQAAKKAENPENIRKAYIRFAANGDYTFSRKVQLKLVASQAQQQTLTVYGLKDTAWTEDMTYNNAPANMADESLFEFDLYNRVALGTVAVDGAGTYYVDVTDYVKEYAPEGMLFVVTSNDETAVVLPEVSLDAELYDDPQPELKFSNAALELHNNLAIQFKTNAGLFESSSYQDPYVTFTFCGEDFTVDTYTVQDGQYVFTFTDIAPDKMGETIQATLHADWNGEAVSSSVLNYSVKDYCYRMLSNSTVVNSEVYAPLRTLLVDLLNYGAVSQQFTAYNTDALVNAELTDTQKAWGTATEPTLESILKTSGTVETAEATWKTAGLVLKDAVVMRFGFAAEDTTGMSVVIESGDQSWTVDSFTEEDGKYFAYFEELNAGQMRQEVTATVYKDGVAVSKTIHYSIETYAARNQNADAATYPYLAELVKAMMVYGDAAYAFANP